MCSVKERIRTYLRVCIDEMDLIEKMSVSIESPEDFGQSITGMTVFRACGMSLQYITENFIKIRNKVSEEFFSPYKQVPWKAVFGMRNVCLMNIQILMMKQSLILYGKTCLCLEKRPTRCWMTLNLVNLTSFTGLMFMVDKCCLK